MTTSSYRQIYTHYEVLKAYVVVPTTEGVSRSTFCPGDTHTDSQGENNTSLTAVAGNYYPTTKASLDVEPEFQATS